MEIPDKVYPIYKKNSLKIEKTFKEFKILLM